MAHTTVVPRCGTFFPRIRPEDLLAVDHPGRSWPPRDLIRLNPVMRGAVFAILFLALTVALAPLVGLMTGTIFSGHPRYYDIATAAAQLPMILAALISYWALGKVWEQRQLIELSWRRLPWGLGSGLLIGATLISCSVGILAAMHHYQVLGTNPDYWFWGDLMLKGFGAAIIEEIVFRGVALRLLEDVCGTWVAVIGSAVAFGLIHLGNPLATWTGAIGIILEAGLLLGALYALTRSLWVVIGVHFAWNMMLGPVFGLVVSGTASYGSGWLDSVLNGPQWATGGVFGIEASWITITLATLTGVAAMIALARSHQVVHPAWVRRAALRALARARSDAEVESVEETTPDPGDAEPTEPDDSPPGLDKAP